MLAEIKITNAKSGVTVVDIEGVIGVPEEWQFDEPAGRVATYKKFKDTLGAISQIRSGEVVVNIRSTGGDVGDALLIYDALCSLDAKISTRCYGYVASAATIIAQAASEGRREVSANSLYLIHNAVSVCEGNAEDFRQREQLLKKTDERIASIYARHSGRDLGEFITLMSENNGSGRWLSPEETLSMKMADRITDPTPISNEASQLMKGIKGAQKTQPTRKNIATRIAALVDLIAGEKPTQLPSNTADDDVSRWQNETEFEQLRQKISTLESENAQLRALPTQIKTKEDPSPTANNGSSNQTAYQRDVESILR